MITTEHTLPNAMPIITRTTTASARHYEYVRFIQTSQVDRRLTSGNCECKN